ncbi:hypothetical protein [Mycobacterium aquaticum]|uniref:Uncharacterized protein n=1 Tax=Mycobacterium aquaticum TaxID=1927124 RepID=A0A1X0BC90_9MYCO|nr:hypothetical protein [Mycobacterium aquaticum]ORA39819.1 hypothetical protein BST13_00170 [Mycobacterium aquaticum]
MQIDVDQIYPYLVPEDYPDALSTGAQAQRQIGHGLSVALVAPTGPPDALILAAVGAEQLATVRIDLPTAYAHADRALSRSLSAGRVAMEFFERGPAGAPTVVMSGSWLAATTLVASGLHERMVRLVGDDIVAAVPHRDLLFLFGADSCAGMGEIIEAEYRTARKPLTTKLFTLGPDGPAPRPWLSRS